MDKYNTLFTLMDTSLKDIRKIVTGETVMSQELDNMYNFLLVLKVPPVWKIYDSQQSLSSWFKDLKSRIEFIRNWLMHGVPNVFRLSAFIFPQGFLTGVLQAHTRVFKIPVDLLLFNFEVTNIQTEEHVKNPPKNGIYVSGLYLEGAMWDQGRRVLGDLPQGQLYVAMNVITFIPVDEEIEHDHGMYLCPLYKTAERRGILTTTGISSNFIIAINLPCIESNKDKWTLRGAALLTEIIN